MEFLGSLFIGKPLTSLAVAAVWFFGYGILRSRRTGTTSHPRPLLYASLAWLAYAAWELLILVKTPEANIRVDVFVIWPVLAMLSMWGLYRAFR